MAVAGFAVASGAMALGVLAAPSGPTMNLAECPVGTFWDPVTVACIPVVNPVIGPAGPVGVGGVVGPVGVDPVVGPAGPVGVGGVVGPVGADPVVGPAGPVGVGGVAGPVGIGR